MARGEVLSIPTDVSIGSARNEPILLNDVGGKQRLHIKRIRSCNHVDRGPKSCFRSCLHCLERIGTNDPVITNSLCDRFVGEPRAWPGWNDRFGAGERTRWRSGLTGVSRWGYCMVRLLVEEARHALPLPDDVQFRRQLQFGPSTSTADALPRSGFVPRPP
jgi:hypothetical protein